MLFEWVFLVWRDAASVYPHSLFLRFFFSRSFWHGTAYLLVTLLRLFRLSDIVCVFLIPVAPFYDGSVYTFLSFLHSFFLTSLYAGLGLEMFAVYMTTSFLPLLWRSYRIRIATFNDCVHKLDFVSLQRAKEMIWNKGG
jgi:hypothetical protein